MWSDGVSFWISSSTKLHTSIKLQLLYPYHFHCCLLQNRRITPSLISLGILLWLKGISLGLFVISLGILLWLKGKSLACTVSHRHFAWTVGLRNSDFERFVQNHLWLQILPHPVWTFQGLVVNPFLVEQLLWGLEVHHQVILASIQLPERDPIGSPIHL